MSENDFIDTFKKQFPFRKKCFQLVEKKKVFPHNVSVFEEEHRLYLSNVVESAVESSSIKIIVLFFLLNFQHGLCCFFTKKGE